MEIYLFVLNHWNASTRDLLLCFLLCSWRICAVLLRCRWPIHTIHTMWSYVARPWAFCVGRFEHYGAPCTMGYTRQLGHFFFNKQISSKKSLQNIILRSHGFFQFLTLKLTDLFTKNQVHPLVHLMFTQGSPLRGGPVVQIFCRQSVLINNKIISTQKFGPPSRPWQVFQKCIRFKLP